MSDDLVKKLRKEAKLARDNWADVFSVDPCLVEKAADLIEQQAARIAALEEGLRDMRSVYVQFDSGYALDRIVDMISELLGDTNG